MEEDFSPPAPDGPIATTLPPGECPVAPTTFPVRPGSAKELWHRISQRLVLIMHDPEENRSCWFFIGLCWFYFTLLYRLFGSLILDVACNLMGMFSTDSGYGFWLLEPIYPVANLTSLIVIFFNIDKEPRRWLPTIRSKFFFVITTLLFASDIYMQFTRSATSECPNCTFLQNVVTATNRATKWPSICQFYIFADQLSSTVITGPLCFVGCVVDFVWNVLYVYYNVSKKERTFDGSFLSLVEFANFLLIIKILPYIVELYWTKFWYPKARLHEWIYLPSFADLHQYLKPSAANIFVFLQISQIFVTVSDTTITLVQELMNVKLWSEPYIYYPLTVYFLVHHIWTAVILTQVGFKGGTFIWRKKLVLYRRFDEHFYIQSLRSRIYILLICLGMLFGILTTLEGGTPQCKGDCDSSVQLVLSMTAQASLWMLDLIFILYSDSIMDRTVIKWFCPTMYFTKATFFASLTVLQLIHYKQSDEDSSDKNTFLWIANRCYFVLTIKLTIYMMEQLWSKFWYPDQSLHYTSRRLIMEGEH